MTKGNCLAAADDGSAGLVDSQDEDFSNLGVAISMLGVAMFFLL